MHGEDHPIISLTSASELLDVLVEHTLPRRAFTCTKAISLKVLYFDVDTLRRSTELS